MRSVMRLAACALAIAGLSIATLSAQTPLVANAGPDQSGMFVGTTVNLTGAGSTGATTFAWTFTKRPSGSTAVLVNPTSVTPSFVPDRGGQYIVKLTVGNGITTKTDTVNITTANRAPTANAGPESDRCAGGDGDGVGAGVERPGPQRAHLQLDARERAAGERRPAHERHQEQGVAQAGSAGDLRRGSWW